MRTSFSTSTKTIEFGSRSAMLYGVWTAGGAMQPYAPYSRTPRSKVQPWTAPRRDTRPGTGQQPLSFDAKLAGTRTSGRMYAADFDWDARDWGGKSNPDPVFHAPEGPPKISDEEWARMSPEDRDAYLDAEEEWLSAMEAAEEDQGFLARMEAMNGGVPVDTAPAARDWKQVEKDRREADRRRAEKAKSRRARKTERKNRKNRHNQHHR